MCFIKQMFNTCKMYKTYDKHMCNKTQISNQNKYNTCVKHVLFYVLKMCDLFIC